MSRKNDRIFHNDPSYWDITIARNATLDDFSTWSASRVPVYVILAFVFGIPFTPCVAEPTSYISDDSPGPRGIKQQNYA